MYTITPIFEPQFIPAAAAGLAFAPAPTGIVVPPNVTYRIDQIRVTNVTGVACALTIWRIPSGSANTAVNNVIPVTVVVPPSTLTAPQFDLTALWGAVLRPGDAIWAQAGAASALTIYGDGAVII